MEFAVDLLLKATLLLALTGLASAVLTKASAAARHLVLTIGLAGSLLLPPLTLLLPRWSVPLLTRPGAPAPVAESALAPRVARETSPSLRGTLRPLSSQEPETERSVSAPLPRAGHAGVEIGTDVTATPRLTRNLSLPSLPAFLLALWATGALAALARLAGGLARVRALALRARPVGDSCASLARELSTTLGLVRGARILSSDAVLVPMTSGVFRPFVLLPRGGTDWPAARRRVVLLHELAHVARQDSLSLLVVEITAALYWFHPLARSLAARCRRECESAADDLVLAADVRPSDYAAELLAIVRTLRARPGAPLPTVAMARPAEFEGRVRAILNPDLPRSAPSRRSSGLAAAAAFLLVGGLAALSPWTTRRVEAAAVSDTPSPIFFGAADPSRVVVPAPSNTVFAARRVAKSVERSEVVTVSRRQPTTAKGWFARAQDLHNDEHWADAADAFAKAYEGGYREGTSAYNAACGYARLNDRDRAFEWLGKSAEAGFDVASYLDHDDDLDNLRDDARFRDLKKTSREKRIQSRKNESARAAAKYERLAAQASTDGSALFQVGRELHNDGRYDLAEKAYRTAATRGYRESTSLYNAACAAAMRNDRAAALALLKASLEAGFDDPDHMAKDDDLESLHSDAGFRELQNMADELTLSDVSSFSGFGPFKGAFHMTRRAGARDAARRYEAYAKKHPESGRAHFNLGFAQLAGDRPEAAVTAFQRAYELGYRKPVTMYDLSCAYARVGDKDKAFEWLFKSIDAGFGDRGQIRSDEDLDSLHGDPRFSEALRKVSDRPSKHGGDDGDDGGDDDHDGDSDDEG